MRLSVVVITKNEEANIGRCLEAVRWADEIILIDSQSTDRTVEIAQEFGAKIYSPEWRGYGHAKRTGVDHASGEWVLSVDADEVVSDELSDSIRAVLDGESLHAGYYVNRRTNFLGRWINHCGWYPDRVLRLFRRDAGNFDEAVVHEQVIVSGTTGQLTGDLLHYSYPTLERYLAKFDVYTTLGAEKAYARGKRAGWTDIVLRPPVSFVKHYLIRLGFLDGWEGLVISVMSSVAVFVKYAKLRHLAGKDRA